LSARLEKDAKKAAATLKNARGFLQQGRKAEAETACRLYLQLAPDNTAVLLDLGLMLMQSSPAEAAGIFEDITQRDVRNANALAALARLRMEGGQRDVSLELAGQALGCQPAAPVLNRLGVLYREAGLNDEAIKCFSEAIRRQPDLVAAYHALGQLQKIPVGSPEYNELLNLHKNAAKLPPQQQSVLEYTLARIYLAAGDADKGFLHYAAAHGIRKASARYNPDLFDHYIDTIIALSDSTMAGSCSREQPVFIVGLPRSGSTLVDQILCSHPDVQGVGEASFLQDSMPFFANTEAPGSAGDGVPTIGRAFMDNLDAAALDTIAQKYLARTAGTAARVTDKMLFNYLWIGVIFRAFPRAHVIHCTRDPLDCGLSIWQTYFSDGLMPWANDLGDIGRYMRSYQKLMAHWEKLFPGKIYTANYEAMIADQATETRKLLEYCGLPWNDACLSFHKTERQVKTASAAQVRQPLYVDSIGKGRAFAKYLAPLVSALDADR
jgi:tetratricopeptide (TPR) repeat protein